MKELGLQDIPVADIDTSFRLRAVDEAYAAAIADNIGETGRLRQPIEVRAVKGGYRLLAGGHRLRAAEMLNWETIPAFVYDGSDDECRLVEIDENLIRHELNPLDRATFLAERKAIYERLHPETRGGVAGGKARQGSANEIASFAADTAERIGLTARTIQIAVSIATRLAPDVKGTVAGTAIAKNQKELQALAKLGPDAQRKVLALLIGDAPQAASVRQAIDILTGKQQRAAPDGFEKLLASWRHATTEERRQFLRHLKGDASKSLNFIITEHEWAAAPGEVQ